MTYKMLSLNRWAYFDQTYLGTYFFILFQNAVNFLSISTILKPEGFFQIFRKLSYFSLKNLV